MAIIYRKTAAGQAEIETRARQLTPRLRSALILVDGRRNDDELRKLVTVQPDETLQALLQQGLIEIAGVTQPKAPVRPATPTAATPGAATAAGATSGTAAAGRAVPGTGGRPAATPTAAPAGPRAPSAPAPSPGRSFAAVQREAVRSVIDLMGPAGETLALKLEQAKNEEQLRPLLELAASVIAGARGSAAGAQFTRQFIGAPAQG